MDKIFKRITATVEGKQVEFAPKINKEGNLLIPFTLFLNGRNEAYYMEIQRSIIKALCSDTENIWEQLPDEYKYIETVEEKPTEKQEEVHEETHEEPKKKAKTPKKRKSKKEEA